MSFPERKENEMDLTCVGSECAISMMGRGYSPTALDP